MGETMIYCPFCEKQTIKAFHRPAYTGFGKSRGSGVTSTFSTKHQEEHIILSGCSNCGKTLEEVRKKS
ncbi:MAG: hypothetical protein V1708_03760 [Candidatus Micrarchaeota archaeon]